MTPLTCAEEPWVDRAVCRDLSVDLFFPNYGDKRQISALANAKAVCATCPVRPECLDWALRTNSRHGVFGGTTPDERHDLHYPRRPRRPRRKAIA